MNVRIASPITIRSGFITRRIVARARSRRISFIEMRFSDRRWMSANTAEEGSGMSSSERARGRAAASSWRSAPNTFCSHQRATSGNDSSRSVSPVGAQSTTITSHASLRCWAWSANSANSSSIPGGTVSSSAAIRSTPWSTSSSPSHSCTPLQWRSSSRWLSTSWPHSPLPASTGSGPSACSSASDRLCAGSVDSTSVRRPLAAQRRAVLAATEVLPTPPFPV